MPIKRCSDQESMTLKEFYKDLAETSTNHYAYVGEAMLLLISMINEMFPEIMSWNSRRLCTIEREPGNY